MPHGTGDSDVEDVMGWAQRAIRAGMKNASGGPRTAMAGDGGVSVGGLDSPLPGGGFGEGEGGDEDGEGEDGDLTGDEPAEALRAAKDAIDRLEAIELGEGAPPKLQKKLDDLRSALSEQSDALEDLASDVEDYLEAEGGDEDGEGEEDGEGDDQGTDDDEEVGPEDQNEDEDGGEKPGDDEDDDEPDEDEDDEDDDEDEE